MSEEKTIELTKDQLDEAADGSGKPKQDLGKRTVRCPSCDTENELPMLIRPGMKISCAECGAELEI